MKRILILGATSAIAEAVARLYAQRSDALFLAGRDTERLGQIAADLGVRGAARVATGTFDAERPEGFVPLLDQAERELGGVDTVLIAHGELPDEAACLRDPAALRRNFEVNAFSAIAFAALVAQRFEARGSGTLAAISSVAGDRGRASNAAYGAAKAAVSAYFSGLRQRLHARGVRVVTIKPGFIDTPMTASFRKGVLWTTPQRIAPRVVAALDAGKAVVYTPARWWAIMAVVKALPDALFVRLRL